MYLVSPVSLPSVPQSPAPRPRAIALYLAHTQLRLSCAALAGGLGCTPATVRRACAAVEDWRDDRAFDGMLDQLATSISALAALYSPADRKGTTSMSHPDTSPHARATHEITREALRLLRALAQPAAYAIDAGADEPDRLVLVAASKGVSLRQLSVAARAGKALVSNDLAQWQAPGKSGRARLTISSAGTAKLARLDAPAGMSPFTAQHAELVVASMDLPSGGKQAVTLDTAESPLAWLARRKGRNGQALIDPVAFQAGERLRSDLTLAQMLPHVTANWGNPASGGGYDSASRNYSDLVIAARQRVTRAMDTVGPEMSGLLTDVCGFLKGLEQIESERQWPARSAKVVLVLALARLAKHYGLASEARGPLRARGITRWGAEDYRPAI